MLTIIGGTYTEVCRHPKWDKVVGSGLRAALAIAARHCALSRTRKGPMLVTLASKKEALEARSLCNSAQVSLKITERAAAIEFVYPHALHPPKLYRPDKAYRALANIKADSALVFSLVEASTSVTAQRLVYDPQAGAEAVLPSVAGHNGEQIVVCANRTELLALASRINKSTVASADADSATLAELLIKHEKLQGVVVKEGAAGALVVTPAKRPYRVACYPTTQVFKIGSGDVFSAVLALHWAESGEDLATAAEHASKATAYYVRHKPWVQPADPKTVDREVKLEAARVINALPKLPAKVARRMYLAGPLFTVSQAYFLDEIRRSLESMGVEVFSPKDEVGYAASEDDIARVAKADLAGLDSCGGVFAWLDGMDPGTLFELGYAVAKTGKPIIAFGQRLANHDLTMLRGTGVAIYDDLTTAVYHAGWMMSRGKQ